MDWDKYPNFSEKEFACQHCGKHGIDERIVDVVQRIREEADFPFIITSGYRCVEHPIEKKKKKTLVCILQVWRLTLVHHTKKRI